MDFSHPRGSALDDDLEAALNDPHFADLLDVYTDLGHSSTPGHALGDPLLGDDGTGIWDAHTHHRPRNSSFDDVFPLDASVASWNSGYRAGPAASGNAGASAAVAVPAASIAAARSAGAANYWAQPAATEYDNQIGGLGQATAQPSAGAAAVASRGRASASSTSVSTLVPPQLPFAPATTAAPQSARLPAAHSSAQPANAGRGRGRGGRASSSASAPRADFSSHEHTAAAATPAGYGHQAHVYNVPTIRYAAIPALAGASAGSTESALPPHYTAPQSQQKRRFMWTEDLHRRFVAAIFDCGLKNATPKILYDLMQPTAEQAGMTSDHIKSHLQKYRNNSRTSRDAFLRDFDRAHQDAELKAQELLSLTGQSAFPIHFSTYPVSMPAIKQQDPAAAALAAGPKPPTCEHCSTFASLIDVGVGWPADDAGIDRMMHAAAGIYRNARPAADCNVDVAAGDAADSGSATASARLPVPTAGSAPVPNPILALLPLLLAGQQGPAVPASPRASAGASVPNPLAAFMQGLSSFKSATGGQLPSLPTGTGSSSANDASALASTAAAQLLQAQSTQSASSAAAAAIRKETDAVLQRAFKAAGLTPSSTDSASAPADSGAAAAATTTTAAAAGPSSNAAVSYAQLLMQLTRGRSSGAAPGAAKDAAALVKPQVTASGIDLHSITQRMVSGMKMHRAMLHRQEGQLLHYGAARAHLEATDGAAVTGDVTPTTRTATELLSLAGVDTSHLKKQAAAAAAAAAARHARDDESADGASVTGSEADGESILTAVLSGDADGIRQMFTSRFRISEDSSKDASVIGPAALAALGLRVKADGARGASLSNCVEDDPTVTDSSAIFSFLHAAAEEEGAPIVSATA